MTDERSERLRQRRQRRLQRAADLEESTAGWECGIGSCSFIGDTVTDLITHQSHDHPPHTCNICQRDVPDGFIAIYHSFEEHSRAEYVKAYDATPDDVRQREQVKAMVERQIDVPALLETLSNENRTPSP
jgi:hypothetical protein